MSPSASAQKAELIACQRSAEHFLGTYGWVSDPNLGTVRYAVWPHLRLLHALEAEHRKLIVLKARQVGVSWHAAGVALHTAMFRPNANVLMLSKREVDASELLDKARFLFHHLPPWLSVATGRSNESRLEFPTRGSKITALPSTEDAGRSEAATLVILDEYAFHQYAESNFSAIRPTIDAGGRMLAISTADGFGNQFARLWEQAAGVGFAQQADGPWVGRGEAPNGFRAVFLPWSVRPGRDGDWYAHATADADPHAAAQEYPSSPDMAFVTSGRPVFPSWALTPEPSLQPLAREQWPLALQSLQGLILYRKPDGARKYLLGADVAQGRADGDASCLVVLDADDDHEVAHYHGSVEPEVFADILDLVASEYAGMLGVESNNQGVSTIGRLRDIAGAGPTRYRLYRRVGVGLEPSGKWRPTHLGRLGWTTTTSTKPRMINDLHEALRTGTLHLATPALLDELRVYARNADGSTSAPGHKHDDRVVALAIAYQMRRWVVPLDTADDEEQPRATRVVGLHGW